MEEHHFQRLLDRFPIVRSRDYCADSERELSACSADNKVADKQKAGNVKDGLNEIEDSFWQKLRVAAESKVGPAKAEKFFKAFQSIHKRLVYEELSLEAAQKFIGGE